MIDWSRPWSTRAIGWSETAINGHKRTVEEQYQRRKADSQCQVNGQNGSERFAAGRKICGANASLQTVRDERLVRLGRRAQHLGGEVLGKAVQFLALTPHQTQSSVEAV